jgi:hypothetical protein
MCAAPAPLAIGTGQAPVPALGPAELLGNLITPVIGFDFSQLGVHGCLLLVRG